MPVPNPYRFVLDARIKLVGAKRKCNSRNSLDGVLVVLQVLRFYCHRTINASIWWMVPDRREAVHVAQFADVSIAALGCHASRFSSPKACWFIFFILRNPRYGDRGHQGADIPGMVYCKRTSKQ